MSWWYRQSSHFCTFSSASLGIGVHQSKRHHRIVTSSGHYSKCYIVLGATQYTMYLHACVVCPCTIESYFVKWFRYEPPFHKTTLSVNSMGNSVILELITTKFNCVLNKTHWHLPSNILTTFSILIAVTYSYCVFVIGEIYQSLFVIP